MGGQIWEKKKTHPSSSFFFFLFSFAGFPRSIR